MSSSSRQQCLPSPMLLVVLLASSFFTFATAQSSQGATIDYSALPACAKQCTLLTQAQDACVPPQAEVTTFDTYESCFCQSGYLTNLASSADGVCGDSCSSTSDLQKISSWYGSACQAGNALVSSDTSTTTSSSAAPTATPTSGGDSSGGDSSSSTSSGSTSSTTSDAAPGSWFSTHWKWVVMLIVIFLAIVGSSILGVWLKRRYRRKHAHLAGNVAAADAVLAPPHPDHLQKYPTPPPPMGAVPSTPGALGNKRSRTPTLTSMRNSSGTLDRYSNPQPVAWGPHQHQAATHGWGYNDGAIAPPSPTVGNGRGKGRADGMVGVQEMPREESIDERR